MPRPEFPVYLHVYPLSDEHILGSLAYHAGVEVHGDEWQYGEGGGIQCIEPGTAGCGAYGKPLKPCYMGETKHNKAKVKEILQNMDRTFTPDGYHIVNQNCVTFGRRFLEELGVQSMPEWVDAYTGKLAPIVESAASRAAVGGTIAVVTRVVGTEALAVGAARTVTAAAGPAAWGAMVGDLVGGGLGARIGGAAFGTDGAAVGKEVGSVGGSVGTAAAVGAALGGPIGAGVGAGVGFLSWGISKGIHAAVDQVASPDGLGYISGSVSSRSQSDCTIEDVYRRQS